MTKTSLIIFTTDDGKVASDSVVAKFATTASDNKR